MDLIKKIFPDYKTKAELKNRIAFLEGVNMLPMPIQTVERNVQKLCVTVEIREEVPMDVLKRKLCRDMAELLGPMMEYDVRDSESRDIPYKYLIGTLYVARR